MSEKMMCSYYPKCSSEYRAYRKHEDVSGTLEIMDGELVFTAKVLFMIKNDRRVSEFL